MHELAFERAIDRHGVSASARVESRPWRLDPLPFVIDAAEFAVLSNAAIQRMRLLEALLVDCAGERQLVRDGVLPAALHATGPRQPGSSGSGEKSPSKSASCT